MGDVDMSMKELIAPTTAAATHTISIDGGMRLTVSAGKLAGAEVVTFQLDEADVVTLGDLYQDGEIRQLTATHNAITIPGPIDIQISKSTTTAAVGVYAKG